MRGSVRLAGLLGDCRGKRDAIERVLCRGAAGLRETRPVSLHRLVFLQPLKCLTEYLRGASVRRHDDAVVHPLALTPGRDDAGIPQICEMAGDFWLRHAENLHEVADADFLLAHQVEEPETRVVAKCLKELLHVELRFASHTYKYICIDECVDCSIYLLIRICWR